MDIISDIINKSEKTISQDEKEQANLNREKLLEKLKKYTTSVVNINRKPIINLTDGDYVLHSNLLAAILKANEPTNKTWNFAENGRKTKLLHAWFCNDFELFEATKMNENQNINKDLFVCGVKGSGKSSTIRALSDYSYLFFPNTKASVKRQFKFVEQNKMANTFEVENNINKYTYNETAGLFEGHPYNIILDDLKFDGLTKSFGTNFKDIIIRFLYDRYSLWMHSQVHTIITSLLTPKEIKENVPDDLYNRFVHQYNIIQFNGENRGI